MSKVIQVDNLSKKFKLYHSPRERLLGFLPFLNSRFEEHTALKNISFSVKKGEFVSIIGRNGSGKSTLLKIICGVLRATDGEFQTNGKVVSLLELGTGFNPDISGRENIANSARVMGFNLLEIKGQIDLIEQFADLAEYFDMPVRTYSSGMYVRLAMSLFLHLEPEIFIIDEALSVGDIFFVQKCFSRIEEMRKKGVTFLFVSHDLNTVQNLSDRVIFLRDGKLVYFGDKHEACRQYYETYSTGEEAEDNQLILDNTVLPNPEHEKADCNLIRHMVPLIPSSEITISCLTITNEKMKHTQSINMMEQLTFIIDLYCTVEIENLYFGLIFKNKYGDMINTTMHSLQYSSVLMTLAIPFTLEPGEYTFDIVVGRQDETNLNVGETLLKYIDFGPISVNFDYSSQLAPFFGSSHLNILSKQQRVGH